MPKYGFKRNSKAISKVLKEVDGGKRAVAQRIFDQLPEDVKKEALITEYQTDRAVVAIILPADKQARDGAGTRAVSQARGD